MPSWEAWARTAPVAVNADRIYLTEIARYADRRGVAKLGRADLAAVTGASPRTVSRRLTSLENAGLLRREQLRGTQHAFDRIRVQLLRNHTRRNPPKTQKPTQAVTAPPTPLAPPADTPLMLEAIDDDHLRAILIRVSTGEKGSRADLAAALNQEGRSRFAATVAKRHPHAASSDAADTISVAYEQAVTNAAILAEARSPWAMLSTYTRTACARVDEEWRGDSHVTRLPEYESEATQPITPIDGDDPAWGYDEIDALPDLRDFVDALVDAGMDPTLAEAGTSICLAYLQDGPSHRHQLIAKDKSLHALGITPAQAREWLTAITGSRRGYGGIGKWSPEELRTAAAHLANQVTNPVVKVA